MGFNDAKNRVLKSLSAGTYQHEVRYEIDVKNELATGGVTATEVAAVIGKCNGTHHSMSRHHSHKSITVHVLKRDGWYIKFYFLRGETRFISVHK